MRTNMQSRPGARQAAVLTAAPPPAESPRLGLPPVAEQPAGQRDREFLEDLYRAHALALVRTAKLLLRDQPSAEDVVQDAFLNLYRALPRITERDQVVPYLRTAVINGSRSLLRKRRRARLLPVHHEPAAASAESGVMLSEERQAVLHAIARLPRRAREVIALRYYLDLPDDEIAAALGVSRGTVSSTASRAVAAVGRELREQS
jgi:RNA polymerase sigma-70 factor (sigma-E family)